ncbi:hypothetical protein ABPG75_011562 [Micractinium tetrahymenae]
MAPQGVGLSCRPPLESNLLLDAAAVAQPGPLPPNGQPGSLLMRRDTGRPPSPHQHMSLFLEHELELNGAAANAWLDGRRALLGHVGGLVRHLELSIPQGPAKLSPFLQGAALAALQRCTQLAELAVRWPWGAWPPAVVQALVSCTALTRLQLGGGWRSGMLASLGQLRGLNLAPSGQGRVRATLLELPALPNLVAFRLDTRQAEDAESLAGSEPSPLAAALQRMPALASLELQAYSLEPPEIGALLLAGLSLTRLVLREVDAEAGNALAACMERALQLSDLHLEARAFSPPLLERAAGLAALTSLHLQAAAAPQAGRLTELHASTGPVPGRWRGQSTGLPLSIEDCTELQSVQRLLIDGFGGTALAAAALQSLRCLTLQSCGGVALAPGASLPALRSLRISRWCGQTTQLPALDLRSNLSLAISPADVDATLAPLRHLSTLHLDSWNPPMIGADAEECLHRALPCVVPAPR